MMFNIVVNRINLSCICRPLLFVVEYIVIRTLETPRAAVYRDAAIFELVRAVDHTLLS